MTHNWDSYNQRNEPRILRTDSGHVNLRTCENIETLQALEEILATHKDAVIVPWVSPPFGVVKGYGIYSRKETGNLIKRSRDEHWGFPRPAEGYDLNWLREKIYQLSLDAAVSASR